MVNGTRGGAAMGWAAAVVLAGWLSGCSSGGASESSYEGRPIDRAPAERELDPSSEPADSSDVQYQFVDTPDGMTVEAVSGDQVQTLSCPTRTCAGYCDECAAAACLAAGQLAGACERLVEDCSSSCSCDQTEGGPASCGFPVCAANRKICYVGPGEPAPTILPNGPEPDPNPSLPASASEASNPTPASANVSRPAG